MSNQAMNTPIPPTPPTWPDRVLTQLRRIHAPVVVGVPPSNAHRDLMQLPDGEIRHYGTRVTGPDKQWVYIASRDCGLSWQEFDAPDGCAGACVQSPWSGDWITTTPVHPPGAYHDWLPISRHCPTPGTYGHRSLTSVNGPFESHKLSDILYGMPRQPLALRQQKRWIVAAAVSGAHTDDGKRHPIVLRSDDDGRTWDQTLLDTVAPHKAVWPHKGVRWQNHAIEPTIVELNDGRLWMLMRTSLDYHYEAFSCDAGETWTAPKPSRFSATLTMPTLFRLNDGRILLFWCNTTPLPEVDHTTQPELHDGERQGHGEDVFTNRDACHAAISDDNGKTWHGFRELVLNERRNDADFRSSGGSTDSLDKSVHQSQALELPGGNVLVSLGQHPLSRRLIIFDPAWLYETQRQDDFSTGLGAWSVHQYVKSLAGNFRGITGHCAYNRRPGAQLIPHPDGEPREVLQIARHSDSRLLHESQGAVWNFPAGKEGSVHMRLRLPQGSQGARICLLDRWFNPVDPVVQHFAQYVIDIDNVGRINAVPALEFDAWHDLTIRWTDCAANEAEWSVGDGGEWTRIELTQPCSNGLCYVHIQSTADNTDPRGLLLAEIEAEVNVAGHASAPRDGFQRASVPEGVIP